LKQICKLIPGWLVHRAVAKHGGGKCEARSWSVWSHVVAMLYAQLSSAIGLNGVCDALRFMGGALAAIREARAPSRNNLSHCNRERPAEIMREVFWGTLEHLGSLCPGFAAGAGRKGKGVLRRFTRNVHLVDSTVIELIATCMSWAKHRRRKAAAKCHLMLNYHTLLPRFAIVDTARESDGGRARELCAALRSGEIVVFDRAYLDYAHLFDLLLRGVSWVTRTKSNMAYRTVRKLPCSGKILAHKLVKLRNKKAAGKYPGAMRMVTALVEVEGREQEMTFLTNNLHWAASSVADLYRARWDIEVFFKQLKQCFRLHGFLGATANAVRWQVWSALLALVLAKFLACLHAWPASFARLVSLLRCLLWLRTPLSRLLGLYGTARGSPGRLQPLLQPWLPGLEPLAALRLR
jgi:hypothetical protein